MTLADILGTLHSDQNRLRFLQSVYTPGNTEVADRILALSPGSSSVMQREVTHAIKHGPEDRVVAMGRTLVDFYINQDRDFTAKTIILEWGNKQLADYAIAKLTENATEDSLKYAAELCMRFDRDDEWRQLTERVFDFEMTSSGKEYPSIPARTAVELERFDVAIDLYIQSGYHWLDAALHIAEVHSLERVTEIATLGFNGYNTDKNHRPELYLACAKILGKEEKVRGALLKEASELTIDRSPGCYEELIYALISLELHNEARSIAERVEAYETEQLQTIRHYTASDQRVLASIFLALGDKEKAAEAYLRKIDNEMPKNHPSHFMPDIDEVHKLTGDDSVLLKKLYVFERDGEYDKAAGFAREIGRTDLAEKYGTMQKMVADVSNQ